MPKPSPRLERRIITKRRAERDSVCAQPRMRKLFESVVAAGGAMAAVRQALGVSPAVLRQRLSLLKRLGVARTVAIFDPLATGRPVESVNLVRLRLHALGVLADFEAACAADPAIMRASRITGTHDYRLTAFHADLSAAAAWARALRDHTEVAAVDQRFVRTLFGHELDGVPLREERGS